MVPNTNSTKGMGQTISILFAKRGCKKILLADISAKGMEETKRLVEAAQPSAIAQMVKVDVTIESQVAAMVEKCVATFGRLDFAINCAGVGKGGVKTADMTVELFDLNCNVNEKGVGNPCRHQFSCAKCSRSSFVKSMK